MDKKASWYLRMKGFVKNFPKLKMFDFMISILVLQNKFLVINYHNFWMVLEFQSFIYLHVFLNPSQILLSKLEFLIWVTRLFFLRNNNTRSHFFSIPEILKKNFPCCVFWCKWSNLFRVSNNVFRDILRIIVQWPDCRKSGWENNLMIKLFDLFVVVFSGIQDSSNTPRMLFRRGSSKI